MGFMRDLKLFRIYGLKRVLGRSYPALRKVLYVHNRILYGTKHCYAKALLDTESALGQIRHSVSPLCPIQTLLDAHTCDSRDPW